jgi:uncharacterized protein YndB with AHSA1/START domain
MTKNNPTKITAEPGKQEFIIEREFNAPHELVFKAFTDPELYVQWSWRYIQRDQDGNEFVFHGVNHEVTAPERIISTFEWEELPEKGHVILQTTRFEELPGNRTRLINQSVFQSVDDRDGMLQSDPKMEEEINEMYNRLEVLLEKMKK